MDWQNNIPKWADGTIRGRITKIFNRSLAPRENENQILKAEVARRLALVSDDAGAVKAWSTSLQMINLLLDMEALDTSNLMLDHGWAELDEYGDGQDSIFSTPYSSPKGKMADVNKTNDSRPAKDANQVREKVSVVHDSVDQASSKHKSQGRKTKSSSQVRSRSRRTSFASVSSDSDDDPALLASAKLNAQANLRVEDMISFSGKCLEWPIFKSQFEDEVLHNPTFTNSRKKTFLSKLCIGPAAAKFRELSRQYSDVETIFETLGHSYERSSKIKQEIELLIVKMPQVRYDHDMENFEEILNQIDSIIATIKSLDERFESYLLLYIKEVASKFYPHFRKKIISSCETLEEVRAEVKHQSSKGRRWKLAKDSEQSHSHSHSHSSSSSSFSSSHRSLRAMERQHSPVRSNHRSNHQSNNYSNYASNSYSKPFRSNLQMEAVQERNCVFCGRDHSSRHCSTPMSYQERRNTVISKRLCRNCLAGDHFESNCNKKGKILCGRCNKPHPTPLHDVRFFTPGDNASTIPKSINSNSSGNEVKQNEVLMVVDGVAKNKSRPIINCRLNGKDARLLLDTGSEQTVISAHLVQPGQARHGPMIRVLGVDEIYPAAELDQYVTIQLPRPDSSLLEVEVLIHPHIRGPDVVLGTDYLGSIMKEGCPPVLETIFGPVPFGVKNVKQIIVQKDSPLEATKIRVELKKTEDGRFICSLPFLSDLRPGYNYYLALLTLERFLASLDRRGLRSVVDAKIQEMVADKQLIQVDDIDGHFIPLQVVVRDASDPKNVRVVIDASRGKNSLNELLANLGVSNLDVVPHLVRSRLKRYLLTCDMKKAFLQIWVKPELRKYLRIVWKKLDGSIVKYEMSRLPFGLICAPGIMIQAVEAAINELPPEIKNIVKDCFYMDDGLIAHDDEQKLLDSFKILSHKLHSCGFDLHKLKSNSDVVRQGLNIELEESSKILGMIWNMKQDSLGLALEFGLEPKIETKRQLASFIARWYDPLGITEPVKLQFRLKFSELTKFDWDDALPLVATQQLSAMLEDAVALKDLAVPRSIQGKVLYGFADASTKAFGYALYLDGHFIFGKSKISPIRTIPSLELLALYECIAAWLKLREQLGNVSNVVFLSDSTITLQRLGMAMEKLKYPVLLKVNQICRWRMEYSFEVRYVNTEDNVADHFSRGLSATEFLNKKLYQIDVQHLAASFSPPYPVRRVASLKANNFTFDVSRLDGLDSVGDMKDYLKRHEVADDYLLLLVKIFQQGQKFPGNGQTLKIIKGVIHVTNRVYEQPLMWIPSGRLADVMIRDAHRKAGHMGVKWSLAQLPIGVCIFEKVKLMQRLIHGCEGCLKRRAKPLAPPLGPLHPHQSKYQPCFSAVAVDIMGPFKYRNGRKYYVLVTICLTTRYIVMEPLANMTADELYAGMMNVFNGNGEPKFVMSDNGSNFMAVRKRLLNRFVDLEWNLVVPGAPWQNGSAERAVRSCKYALQAHEKRFESFADLSRGLKEAEFVLNSRWILQMDERPISAFELRFMRPPSSWSFKHQQDGDDKSNYLQRMQITNAFMNLWNSQYLDRLRNTVAKDERILAVGQRVLCPATFVKRQSWPVMTISDVHKSVDGFVRSVRVDKGNWIPSKGLIPLGREKL